MKVQYLYFLCLVVIAASCKHKPGSKQAQPDSLKNVLEKATGTDSSWSTAARDTLLAGEFKHFKQQKLSDTITADLNGDGAADKAFVTMDKEHKIMVSDGKTGALTKVGDDKSFGDMKNGFNWMDYWGTTNDKETFEVIIKDDEITGGRQVKLDNVSLFVRKDDVGGGVITFKNGKYVWVHQSD